MADTTNSRTRDQVDNVTDPLAWMQDRWQRSGQPGADHFIAMASLLRTHQVMAGELDRLLRKHRLSRNAYLLLITLEMSADRSRPLGRLSKALMVHPTTITLVIDQLEERGLVRRGPHPTDRRTTLATLTQRGLSFVDKATQTLNGASYGLPGVDVDLAKQLTTTLTAVREQIGDV